MTKLRVVDVLLDLDPQKLINTELIVIERTTGIKSSDFMQGLTSGSMEAMTAYVWVMRKRSEPTLKYSDVQFEYGQLYMVDDDGTRLVAKVDEAGNAVLNERGKNILVREDDGELPSDSVDAEDPDGGPKDE